MDFVKTIDAQGGMRRIMQALQGVLAGALFVFFFRHFFIETARYAVLDDNWSHAPVVPLVSLYMLHRRRTALAALPMRSDWRGLPLMAGGMLLYFFGIYPISNVMIRGWAMIFTLFGMLWLLTGPKMRMLWFPVLYLGFGVKVGDRLWTPLSMGLQRVAAESSAVLLQALGVDATVRGTTIELWQGAPTGALLNVAEACSGLRMLMAFVAMGAAVVYVSSRPWHVRFIVLLLTVPIALLINILRVTLLGLLFESHPDWVHGTPHLVIGFLMLFAGLALFLMAERLVDHLFKVERE